MLLEAFGRSFCASGQLDKKPASVVHVFVLGIDPGLTRCGYAVVQAGKRQKAHAVALGVLRTPTDAAVHERLAELQQEVRLLHDEYQPVAVAVEKVFFSHNASTAIGVAQASGLVLAEAATRGADVHQYSPTMVKAVVAGDGTADKSQVQEMVQMLLGLSKMPKPADAADAAALALCHLAHDPFLEGQQHRADRVVAHGAVSPGGVR